MLGSAALTGGMAKPLVATAPRGFFPHPRPLVTHGLITVMQIQPKTELALYCPSSSASQSQPRSREHSVLTTAVASRWGIVVAALAMHYINNSNNSVLGITSFQMLQ